MPRPIPPLTHSLNDLIAPAHLVRLLDLRDGDWHIGREIVEGGMSGAIIQRLILFDIPNERHSLVIKQIDPAENWLMRAAGDTRGREIDFTQSGLWERIPDAIRIPILGVARLEDGKGAVLMQDVDRDLLPATLCYEPVVDEGVVERVLDGLAILHSTFWEDEQLGEQEWLASPHDALFVLTPDNLANAGLTAVGKEYGEAALRMWYRLWSYISKPAAEALRQVIRQPERLLAAIASAPRTLLHGDAWIANLGIQDDALILLDWAMVTAGPPTYDSLWFAHTWHALDPDAVLRQHRDALVRHGVTAVADDDVWSLLVDLAWVRTTLMGIEWMMRDIIGSPTNEEERAARERLAYWVGRTTNILLRRGWVD